MLKEWARSWAKRTIIQNAIRELKPHPLAISLSLALPPNVVRLPSDQDRHFAVDAVLGVERLRALCLRHVCPGTLFRARVPCCPVAPAEIFGAGESALFGN